MILDPESWKQEIQALKEGLVCALDANDDFEIEKHLYYLAILIRKLVENRLSPKSLASKQIKVSRFSPATGPVDALNYLDALAHYQLKTGTKDQLDLKRVVDLIIHSSFLDWRMGNQKCEEFLVSSDREPTAVGIEPQQFMKLIDYVLLGKFRATPLLTARRNS